MTIANDIVNEAYRWYKRQCVETATNRGPCVDEIHERFDPNWIRNKRSEAWCAKFVWVVVDTVCRAFGIPNPLPRTAGAYDLLQKSRRAGLRVDRQPARGAIFYRRSGSPGASGHVGIVSGGRAQGGITTIEGNLNNRVALYDYTLGDLDDLDFWFIHVEDLQGSSSLLAGTSPLSTLLLISAAVGAIYLYHQRRR